MINKKSAACVAMIVISMGVGKAAWNSGDIMVGGDAVAWFGVSNFKNLLLMTLQTLDKLVLKLLRWWNHRTTIRLADGGFCSNARCTLQIGYVAYGSTWLLTRDKWASMESMA